MTKSDTENKHRCEFLIGPEILPESYRCIKCGKRIKVYEGERLEDVLRKKGLII